MEHYLGEKLKNLRESRNWSQAELAKRLNKAVSTISGYESDAHAIPLDVLVSISLLFGVSTDELLDLETTNVLSLSGLTEEQCNLLRKIRQQGFSFLSDLSHRQLRAQYRQVMSQVPAFFPLLCRHMPDIRTPERSLHIRNAPESLNYPALQDSQTYWYSWPGK